MKRFFISGLFILVSMVYITGCSSMETTVREDNSKKPDSVYIFDVPEDSLFAEQSNDPEESEDSLLTFVINTSKNAKTGYAVQLGAFGEEKNAKTHAENSKKVLGMEVRYFFSKEVNFWVVQLIPVNKAADAHKVKRDIRKKKEYKDAFVVKVIE